MFQIAFLAHKYEFTALLEWSFDTILLQIPDSGSIQGVSVDDLKHLLLIASESNANEGELAMKIQEHLVEAISQSEEQRQLIKSVARSVAERWELVIILAANHATTGQSVGRARHRVKFDVNIRSVHHSAMSLAPHA